MLVDRDYVALTLTAGFKYLIVYGCMNARPRTSIHVPKAYKKIP